MEDATITQEPTGPTGALYPQGRYPSVIDTDDLVFEIGRLTIGNLNKEKLLDTLLQKSRVLEKLAIEAQSATLAAEERKLQLEKSNKLYVENNQKLGVGLVEVRQENNRLNIQIATLAADLQDSLAANEQSAEKLKSLRASTRKLRTEIRALKAED